MGYSVNRATILGNVGRDPEIRTTAHGQAVCNVVVGTDTNWTNKKTGEAKSRTSWHKVTAWGPLAELCAKILKTGSKVYVDGELLYEDYTAKDGSPRQKAFIKADQVVMMDGQKARGIRRDEEAPKPRTTEAPGRGWDETGSDEGIPF